MITGITPRDLQDTAPPMLATPNQVPITSLGEGYVFEQKYDGLRATASWQNGLFRLMSRTGRDITDPWLELQLTAGNIDGPLLLDGEIVAESGSFDEVNARSRRKAISLEAIREQKAKYVAFDILLHPTEGDVRHLPYTERRKLLCALPLPPRFEVSLASANPEFYDQLKALGAEGVIAKRTSSRYASGYSPNWIKYKAKASVTCIAIGYQPGNGSRAHMGAALLGLIDGGQVLPVGKAGSGFTQETSTHLVELITAAAESGSLEKFPVIEVECLGITKAGKLRQPVFKGFRTDRSPMDARSSQLSELTTS